MRLENSIESILPPPPVNLFGVPRSMEHDIVLIQPDFNDKERIHFPMSALTLGSFLKRHDFSPAIHDFNYTRFIGRISSEMSIQNIPLSKYRIYGITVYFGQLRQSLKIARFLRQRETNCLVVLGGPGLYGLGKQVLSRFDDIINCVVEGEGERILLALMQELRNSGDAAPCWHQRIEVQQDFLPTEQILPLEYELIPAAEYFSSMPHREMPVLAGAGCPYNCMFCSTSSFWGRKFRRRSAFSIHQEMMDLARRFQADLFMLVHDNLLLDSPEIMMQPLAIEQCYA